MFLRNKNPVQNVLLYLLFLEHEIFEKIFFFLENVLYQK